MRLSADTTVKMELGVGISDGVQQVTPIFEGEQFVLGGVAVKPFFKPGVIQAHQRGKTKLAVRIEQA